MNPGQLICTLENRPGPSPRAAFSHHLIENGQPDRLAAFRQAGVPSAPGSQKTFAVPVQAHGPQMKQRYNFRRIPHVLPSYMQKSYAIAWFSHATKQSGAGKAVFTKKNAEILAAQLNKDHPRFTHTPCNTADRGVAAGSVR
jgi:hypothetical protein